MSRVASSFSSVTTLTLLLLFAGLAEAQQLQPFTAADALEVSTVRVESLTPDGLWLAATIQRSRDRLDVDHERYGDPTYVAPSLEELVVFDTETGDQRKLFDGKVQSSALEWSPDGKTLAFFLYDGERFGLYVYDRERERVRRVELRTDKEIASSSNLQWRPDGSGVLISLRADGWREVARTAFLELSEGPVVIQDGSDPFLDWDRVRNLGRLTVPAIADLPSGEVREILVEGTYAGVEQSEDGRFVTVTTQTPLKTVYEGSDGSEWGLTRLDLETGESTVLVEPSTERIRTAWNPAGDEYAFADDGDVFLRSIQGDSARKVTPEERGSVSEADTAQISYSVMRWHPDGESLLVGSQRGWHLVDPVSGEIDRVFELEEDEESRPRRSVTDWSPDGRYLYVSTSERDRWERGLARLDLQGGDLQQLVSDPNLYRGWQMSEDGTRIVYTMSDGDHPPDIYVADPALRGSRLVSASNPWLAERKLTRSELVEYLDVDGKRLKGILYYPVDYEPGERYPLVAEIYEEFFDNGFNQNMNLLANEGWFGFRPSVEFEEGFPGEAWLKGVTAGINTLIERGLVDGDRLGVHGTSYGGYATNLLITQTDRFAAAINISGKVNIVSFLGDSPKITTRNYRAAESGQDRIGSTLWEQPQKYIAHSAVMFADRIDTPLLLLSGEGDWNVPATNQREMYYALRRLEKEVVWVHYMNAGHGAGRAGTVSDFGDHWERILAWYTDHFDAVDSAANPVAQGSR